MAKSPTNTNPLKTASVLSFNRHLDTSDGRMTALNWDSRQSDKGIPVINQPKSVRGTISNRPKNTKEQDPAYINAKASDPNLQTVDIAALPQTADTVAVTFSLRVLPDAGTPSSCNNAEFAERLKAVVRQYTEEQGFAELAKRYARSLASGRFLWRNRVGAENAETVVSRVQNGQETDTLYFNALAYPLASMQPVASEAESLQKLADWIEEGLSGQKFVLLKVTGFSRLGSGQEVYPSQELILDKGNGKGGKSKTLYAILPENVAGLHSQKIGNALRTIDTWYPDAGKPIAVEPYGSVTSEGVAYRQPKDGKDFYTLFDDWVNKGKVPDVEQQHYVMANLIRGGVFGESDK